LAQELTKELDYDETQADADVIARKEAALEELADWVGSSPVIHIF
jgi:hypothetical protein